MCSLPKPESEASDERLITISGLYERLSHWAQREISGTEAIDTVRRIWDIEEAEGYWSERGRLAADAAWVAAAHSE